MSTNHTDVAPWNFTDAKQSREFILKYGEKPATRDLPQNSEISKESFVMSDTRTPAGQRYGIGDARRGARLLGTCSALLACAGIAGEVASILAASSAVEQARRLDWPIAKFNPPSWTKCEFLPNSDAPATKYGAGVVIFLHSANIVIFAGLLAFMVRFVREPRADYGIGTAGLIMITLGLRLASKWLGSIQCGILLAVFGFGNLLFGWHYVKLAFKAAFAAKPVDAEAEDDNEDADELQQAENEAKKNWEKAIERKRKQKKARRYRLTPQVAMLQLQAYMPDAEVVIRYADAEKAGK